MNADENGCCPRTVKYLQGLAAGKWIVGHNCECCDIAPPTKGEGLVVKGKHPRIAHQTPPEQST